MHGTVEKPERTRLRVLSWNVLRDRGARPGEAVALARSHEPDLMLLQEAGPEFEALPGMLGGHYIGRSFEGGRDGLGAWSREPPAEVGWLRLEHVPDLKMRRPRQAMIIGIGRWSVANVHLSHGQLLARRQIRQVAGACLGPSAVIGDFNMVGPAQVSGWRDEAPRTWTHLGWGVAPFRLDRCLVRGLRCASARALDRGSSDHRPILIDLEEAPAPSTPRHET